MRGEYLRHHPELGKTPDKFAGTVFSAGSSREKNEATEGLSDERVADLIAAVGNHPIKAALLASMDVDRPKPYTVYPLYNLIRDIKGGSDVWPGLGTITAFRYCQSSLAPIGFVTREQESETGAWGYVKTPLGAREGEALAGYMLEFSEEIAQEGKTLSDYWGVTHTSVKRKPEDDTQTVTGESVASKRAPFYRLQIFRELLKQDEPIRTTDLLQLITENIGDAERTRISSHLKSLAAKDIITYESYTYGKPNIRYTLKEDRPEEKPSDYEKHVTLTRQVYHSIQTLPPGFTIDDVVTEVAAIREAEGVKEYDVKSLKYFIASTLKHMKNEGYLESEGFSASEASQISLTEDQRDKLQKLLDVAEDMQLVGEDYEHFIEVGRAKARTIIRNPERMKKIVKVFVEKSSKTKPDAKIRNKAQIREVVAEFPDGMNLNELYETLKDRYDIKVSRKALYGYVAEMREAGDISTSNDVVLKVHGGSTASNQNEGEKPARVDTFEDYSVRLQRLVRLYRSHKDPHSSEAKTIITKIREIRNNPNYQRLLEERDAQPKARSRKKVASEEPQIGESANNSIADAENDTTQSTTIFTAKEKTK